MNVDHLLMAKWLNPGFSLSKSRIVGEFPLRESDVARPGEVSLVIDPSMTFQEFMGFGTSFTERVEHGPHGAPNPMGGTYGGVHSHGGSPSSLDGL